MAPRRPRPKRDLRSSGTHVSYSRGGYPYVTCIFSVYLVCYTAFLSLPLDRISATNIRSRVVRVQVQLSPFDFKANHLVNSVRARELKFTRVKVTPTVADN